jgi:outer membrane lipoprotein SlyB
MAIGCLGGSVVGAVAGHMVHHGVLGAVGGCIAGHEHQKHLQRTDMQNRDPRQDDRYRQ